MLHHDFILRCPGPQVSLIDAIKANISDRVVRYQTANLVSSLVDHSIYKFPNDLSNHKMKKWIDNNSIWFWYNFCADIEWIVMNLKILGTRDNPRTNLHRSMSHRNEPNTIQFDFCISFVLISSEPLIIKWIQTASIPMNMNRIQSNFFNALSNCTYR